MTVIREIILALTGFSATKNACIKNKLLKSKKDFFDDK
tara:strand:+ start:662 stop:775 length:114 start_codon:yes stop_codon:yes gene_type:complete